MQCCPAEVIAPLPLMEGSCSSLSWAMRRVQSHLLSAHPFRNPLPLHPPSPFSGFTEGSTTMFCFSSQACTQRSGASASSSPNKDNEPWLFSPQSIESGVRPWRHITLSISARQDTFQLSCPEKYNLYLPLATSKKQPTKLCPHVLIPAQKWGKGNIFLSVHNPAHTCIQGSCMSKLNCPLSCLFGSNGRRNT